jgi:hypothetical protein
VWRLAELEVTLQELAGGDGEIISIMIEWKMCLEDALDCILQTLSQFCFAAQRDSAGCWTNFGRAGRS